MEFKKRKLNGTVEIQLKPSEDSRGFFMRTFDEKVFENVGLTYNWVQENHSKSVEKNIMEKNTAQFDKDMKVLEKELINMFSNISSNLDFETNAANKPLNIVLVKELLPQLRKQLEAKSPKAKALIKELEEAGLSGDNFDEMVNKLNKYDFKSAILLLNEIEKSN